MYDSALFGTSDNHTQRMSNNEDEGFDDRQCCEEVMETDLAYNEYQRRSKRKSRRPKPSPSQLQSSLSKDQSLSNCKQRNKIELIFDEKPRKLINRRQSQAPEKKQEPLLKPREIKVPIEYFDESHDHAIHTKKLVYKGYTPRSSHYYLKTLHEIDPAAPVQPQEIRKDCEVSFNSKFESGNLNYAMRINQHEYWLYMREDTNTKGLRQWFYFEVSNRRPTKIRFRVYKFSRYFSLYRKGAKPFVLTKRNATEGGDWQQAGDNIKYDYDSDQKCYYLEFEYAFEEESGVTYFASLPPYTYSKMLRYVSGLIVHETVTKHMLGMSLAGLEIPYLEVKLPSHPEERHIVVVLARTHPGETVSNFALEGFLEVVLASSKLLQKFIFVVVPMVNPDGVYFGNHRTGLLGQDLNRHFDTEEEQFFPEVLAVKGLVRSLKKRGRVRFLFDLHGHSAKKGIFAYAAEQDKNSPRFVYNRIIPKLIERQFSLFDYSECVFRNSKEKKDTARVHFMLKEKITAVTFEQSYSLFYDDKLRKSQPIGVKNWTNFGRALAYSLEEYCKLVEGKDDIVQVLRDFMPEEFVETPPEPEPQLHKTNRSEMNEEVASQNSTTRAASTNLPSRTGLPSARMENIQEEDKESSNETKTDESDLELNDEELQHFKRNIRQFVRPSLRRESLIIPEKQMPFEELELARVRNLRIHYVTRPSVPKIFRIQHSLNLRQRERRLESVKYSHLELPSINKRYG